MPIPADELQTLVRSIQYLNTSDSLVDGTINFQFTVADNVNQQSAVATSTVNVIARNDAPVLDATGANTLTTINEDSANPAGDRISDIISSSGLADAITDADGPLAEEGIAIFFADSTNGTWQYSTDGGANWTGFGTPSSTAALLLSDDALVRFVPNANFNGDASFSYHAWDQSSGTEGGTINLSGNTGGANPLSSDFDTAMITVNPVNDAPELFVNFTSHTILEDATLTFSSAGGNAIAIGDVDANGAEVALTIQVNDGVVSLGSTAGISNLMGNGTGSITLTGTIADINLALDGLTYDSDDNYHGTDQLTITVDDQGNTGDGGNLTEVANVAINITSINDAPVLDTAATLTLTDIDEDDTNSAGNTVGDIIDSDGVDRITDADNNAAEGIAVYFVDNTNGTWQFDTGSGWTAFGAVSPSSVTLLDTSALIRFVPNPSFNGTATFEFHAWDQTQGSSGQTGFDLSANGTGGATAFSVEGDTVTIDIIPDNDAPVVDLDDNDSSGTAGLDFNTSFTVGDGPVLLTDGTSVSDIDSAIETLTIQITNQPDGLSEQLGFSAPGTIIANYDAANGTLTFTNLGSASNADFQAALDSLTYQNTSSTLDTTTRAITAVSYTHLTLPTIYSV